MLAYDLSKVSRACSLRPLSKEYRGLSGRLIGILSSVIPVHYERARQCSQVDGSSLGQGRDDTDSELDSPTVLAGERYTDTVADELTPSDGDRLNSD